MKKFINGLFTGRDNRISGLIAFAIVGMIVLGCNCNKEGGFSFGEAKVPTDAETQALVQGTMQSFASAVESSDFTNFYGETSKQFQQQFTKEYLATAFKVFVDKRTAVVPVLRSTAQMQPVYSPAPNVGKVNMNNVFNVKGIYATSPVPTRFELQYVQENGQWKIIQIQIFLQ